MSILYHDVVAPLVERAGWTLLHSLWQLAAVGLLFALVTIVFRRRSPQFRYLSAVMALSLTALLPAATWLLPTWQSGGSAVANRTASVEVQAADARRSETRLLEEAGFPARSTPADSAQFADSRLEPPLDDSGPLAVDAERSRLAAVNASASESQSFRKTGFLAPIQPWLGWIVGVWVAGVLALSLWHLGGWLLIARIKRRGGELTEPRVLELMGDVQQRLRLSRAVRLIETALVRAPATCGWLKPVVLLPAGLATGLPLDQLEALLAHELAHIRRHDLLVNLLQAVVETLLFYHPAVWWISHRVRVEREFCADEAAAAVCGSRLVYARALTALEERRSLLPGLALAASDGSLKRRIESVLGVTGGAASARAAGSAGLFALLLAASLALALSAESTTATVDAPVLEAAVGDRRPPAKVEKKKDNQPSSPAAENDKAADEETAKQELTSVQRGAAFLRKTQRSDGTWAAQGEHHRVGITAICTLALLKTGAKPDDADVRRALASLRKARPKMIYDIALQTLALCAAEPKQDLALIQHNVGLLEAAQIADGDNRGGWSYHTPGALIDTSGDNSNSGFAVWALDEAAHAGAKVKRTTWFRALHYWKKGQRDDGSWGYTLANSPGTGSMTCAGIASLVVCLNRKPPDEVTKEEKDALDRGVTWLGENFAVVRNPNVNGGVENWTLYYLMKLRRVGEVTGVRWIGKHQWYREMAEFLRTKQSARDGSWRGQRGLPGAEARTAMALLALQTGPPPQLAADVQRTWGGEGRVVDELGQPLADSWVSVVWYLGGGRQESFARADIQGRFTLVYPPRHIDAYKHIVECADGMGTRPTVIGEDPLVLQVPRYRYGIRGIWQVKSWVRAGRKEKLQDARDRLIFITDDQFIVWNGDKKLSEEVYTIDPSVTPQQIDLGQNNNRARGIFRLDDDRLTLCLNRDGRGRPSKFTSEVVSPSEYLIELKRYGDFENFTDDLQDEPPADAKIAAAHRRIVAALDEQTEMEWQDAALSDAFEFIGDLHDIDIEIDEAALKNAGVKTGAPVTLKLGGVKLQTALRIILHPLKLRYEVRDGRLVVTSRGNESAKQ